MTDYERINELRRRFPNGEKPQPPIPYTVQYYAAVAVFLCLLVTGAIQLVGPDDLGLSPIVYRWIGVFGTVLGGMAAVLPKLQSPPDGRR